MMAAGRVRSGHDLVFPRGAFELRDESTHSGPQDPEKVSARRRTVHHRLGLPEDFQNKIVAGWSRGPLETEKPQVNWGFCWCPRGDLNPHAR
jgi:hypothetical protein